MKKTTKTLIFIGCFVCGSAFGGKEVDNALEQFDNSIGVGTGFLNLNYKENYLAADSDQKGGETGFIFGFSVDVKNTFWKRLYTDLGFDYYWGQLNFDGTNRTTHVAAPGDFEHRLLGASLKIGPLFTFTEDRIVQIIPYVGTGYRYWYRQGSNNGVQKKYSHYKAIGGIRVDWLVNENFILSPYVEGGKIFQARGATLDLGKKTIYEAGLEANYRVFDEFFLRGFASYSQFKYGRSTTVNNNFEPDSKTQEIKIGLGVRYSWMID